MTNLRARQLTVRDSTTIEVTFTAGLDHNIGSANVTINGAGSNASGLTVRSVSVSGWTLTVQVQPMAPGVLYEMILASTSSQPFAGTHGERLVEDGATNHIFFTGIEEESDTFQSLKESLPSIYDPKSGSLLRDLIMPTAKEIETAKHAAGEVSAANYVSVEVVDEEITRGSGPYDRFANEGVFKLLRVGATATSASTSGSMALPAGVYEITFELAGFRTFKRADVRVVINQTLPIDVKMEGATLEETVTVSGKSPIVDTSTQQVGTNFTKELLTEIPNAAEGYDLAALSAYLQRLKQKFPERLDATLLLEPDVPYDSLVQVMDTVRVVEQQQGGRTVQAELFPVISIGDAPL